MEWYLKVMRQYADFSGRARRKEYWMFILFYFLIIIAAGFFSFIIGETLGMILIGLIALIHFIPSLSVAIRRLHDTGKSGWYLLIGFIPLIGSIIMLVFYCTDSDEGRNQWGPDPKGDGDEGDFVKGVLDSF